MAKFELCSLVHFWEGLRLQWNNSGMVAVKLEGFETSVWNF